METVDDSLALPREAAEFVHALVLARGAKGAVEIGTSYGYSGLWIASALSTPGGRLVTIDCDPRKSEAARATFAEAGLAGHVEVRTGDAGEILATLSGPVDFVLNDADKENCIRYIELLDDKLSDRGVVLTDNTETHAEELAGFLEWIRNRPDFISVNLPIGSGMEFSLKRAAR